MIDLSHRILNVLPDPIDPRDRDFRSVRLDRLIPLPESVDHAGDCGQVTDQGDTGSCVGQACASLRYWLCGHEVSHPIRFSPRWIWMVAKEIDPWIPSVLFEYAGTRIRDALKGMRKYGCAREVLWPFEQPLPDPDLEQTIQDDAFTYRIGPYWRLRTVEQMKAHLVSVGPFVAGVPVFENWDAIDQTGRVSEPGGLELGGHAILVVGYDPTGLEFKNSWGSEWGLRGYGILPFDYPIWDAWGTKPGGVR